MIKIENSEIMNWIGALRGMRNPMNSWSRGDSYVLDSGEVHIGDNDLKLLLTLCKAGTDHRKVLRQVMVSMDITAPRFWWEQFSTYRVGVVQNSCSTMHRLTYKPFEVSDFSFEHLINGKTYREIEMQPYDVAKLLVDHLNNLRELYLETKSKDVWWQMIELLPQSYNQKRTITLNYEVLVNMYFARKDHKLDEWHTFCDWIKTLPYMKDILDAIEG